MFDGSGDWRISARFPSAPRQPEMVPSSLTNKNVSPLNAPLPPAELKTCPVTLPSPGILTPVGEGNDSLVATFVVGLTEYKVETPAPLLEIQNGLPPEAEIPQGLINCESVASVAKGVATKRSLAWAWAASP